MENSEYDIGPQPIENLIMAESSGVMTLIPEEAKFEFGDDFLQIETFETEGVMAPIVS